MNIKMISSADRERTEFARRAAEYFNSHPGVHTFTDGDVEHGKLLAIRWAANGMTTPKKLEALRGLVRRGANLLEANTDKSSRRVFARAIYDELALTDEGATISVLVIEIPYDAVLVGDLDTGR